MRPGPNIYCQYIRLMKNRKNYFHLFLLVGGSPVGRAFGPAGAGGFPAAPATKVGRRCAGPARTSAQTSTRTGAAKFWCSAHALRLSASGNRQVSGFRLSGLPRLPRPPINHQLSSINFPTPGCQCGVAPVLKHPQISLA
jgi:hypothetical protein